jgi:PhoPQ-activated pathogenicity-related protein
MRYQLESWGKFSEQIDDYSRKGLIKTKDGEESPREAALRTMMDPWTYRERLSIPKLIVNGTNDRYWVVDAAKNYYGELTGPKNVLEIPNAGHGLDGGRDKVTATIAVLFRRVASGTSLPKLEWTFTEGDTGERKLTLSSDAPAESGRLWMATSDNNDFRESKWTDERLDKRGDAFEGAIPATTSAGVATFGELRFVDRTIEPPVQFSLTTTVKRYGASEATASK